MKKIFILTISTSLVLLGIYSVIEGFTSSDLGSGMAIGFGMLILIIGLALFPKRQKKPGDYQIPKHLRNKINK